MFAGAIIGLILGGFYGTMSAPHNWITTTWIVNMTAAGTIGGAIGGGIIAIVNWLMHKDAIGKKIGRIKIKAHKTACVILGMIIGMMFGGLIGVAYEAIVRAKLVSAFPQGTFSHLVALSKTVYVVPVIGAVVGAIYGWRQQMTDEIVKGLAISLLSGMAVGWLSFWFFFGFLQGAIAIMIFGTLVAVIIEIISIRFSQDVPS